MLVEPVLLFFNCVCTFLFQQHLSLNPFGKQLHGHIFYTTVQLIELISARLHGNDNDGCPSRTLRECRGGTKQLRNSMGGCLATTSSYTLTCTIIVSLICYHTHPLTHYHTLSHSLSYSPSHTLSYSLSFTIILSHSLSNSLIHYHNLSYTINLSLIYY